MRRIQRPLASYKMKTGPCGRPSFCYNERSTAFDSVFMRRYYASERLPHFDSAWHNLYAAAFYLLVYAAACLYHLYFHAAAAAAYAACGKAPLPPPPRFVGRAGPHRLCSAGHRTFSGCIQHVYSYFHPLYHRFPTDYGKAANPAALAGFSISQ